MKAPDHWPVAVGKACYVGDIVAVVVADSRYEAADAVDAVVVDYDPLRGRGRHRGRGQRPRRHPRRPGHQPQLHVDAVARPRGGRARLRRRGPRGHERYVQQRLIPEAMETRGVAAVPGVYGGDLTVYSATQIPHILKVMIAATCGVPEHKVRVVAPSVGGGFGSKLNVYAEELIAVALARPAGRARPLDRGPQRERGRHDPGPGPGPAHGAGGRRRRQGHRRAGQPAGRHGRLPAARHPRHPAARRVPLPRRLRRAGVPLRVHRRVHEPHADRRLPGRRSARGHLRHRAGHGHPGPRGGGRRRRRSAGATTSRPTSSPTTSIAGLTYDSGDYEPTLDRALELVGYDERASRAAATARGRRHQAPRHRRGHLRRDVRPGPQPGARVAELLRRRLGGRHGAGAAHRHGPGGERYLAPRPGPRDLLVADRGRQARRRPRRRRGPALRHRHQPALAWTPTAAARCRSAGWRWPWPPTR